MWQLMKPASRVKCQNRSLFERYIFNSKILNQDVEKMEFLPLEM